MLALPQPLPYPPGLFAVLVHGSCFMGQELSAQQSPQGLKVFSGESQAISGPSLASSVPAPGARVCWRPCRGSPGTWRVELGLSLARWWC